MVGFPFKPMLCEDAPKDDYGQPVGPVGPEWIYERKENGWRFLFSRDEDRVRSYAGRNGANRSGQPAQIEKLLSFLPVGTVLDSELIVPGEDSAMVSTALANPRIPLRAIVFDVLALAGTDLRAKPWHIRRAYLEAMSEAFNGENVTIGRTEPAERRIHQNWIDDGYEGSIAKRVNSVYRSGLRSWDWVKIKPQLTAEAEIIGFVEGKGSRRGRVGAFQIRLLDGGVETSVGTLDDAQRADVEAHPDQWLGAVVEFSYSGLMRSGKPRHPVAPHRRDDRDVGDSPPRGGTCRDAAGQDGTGPDTAGRGVATQGSPRHGETGQDRSGNGKAGQVNAGQGMAPQIPKARKKRMRNYQAMLVDNLERCVDELEREIGDAYDRVLLKGEDVAEHLRVARAALDKKKQEVG